MNESASPVAPPNSGEGRSLPRLVLEHMTEGFSLLDHDFNIIDINDAAVALDGRPREQLIGSNVWEVAPELERTEFGQLLRRVMTERAAAQTRYQHRWDDGRTAFLEVRIFPVDAGIALLYRDVSGEVASRLSLEDATRRLDAVLNNTTMAVFLMDAQQRCVYANRAAEHLTGYPFEQMGGQQLHNVIHHKRPDGSHYPLEDCPIDRAFPERAQMQGEELFVAPDGSFYPVAFTASPVLDEDGHPVGTVLEARNIKEEKAERARLGVLQKIGEALAAELDLQRIVQLVTDAGVELTGAHFGAFFYKVRNDKGENYTLYSISGVDRSAFENFPMPRATDVFRPTFEGEGVVRSNDILKDPRYGNNAPYKGMPEGHLPVRSYLAVPVMSRTGDVLGGLFFGHPKPARFTGGHEQLMLAIAAQASVAVDNARLYSDAQQEIDRRRAVEDELRKLNDTLEQRVQQETASRMQVEQALRQAQKMEAVGQLTGGIAHDFNNLLTVVTGNIDMANRALAGAPNGDPRVRRALDNAQKGAERAAALTQRLLAFSRRQPLAPKQIDVDRLILGMSDLLNRALGETVELEVVTSPGLWRVEADPNQLESALLNLAVNARDAMAGGGKLTIETTNIRLEETYSAAHAEVAPGQYVVVCVTDTGHGMSKETMARIFEPFYTTKEVGKGSGLGLSMVYGFVKQSGGHVNVYSEEGHGTTVKIYLPRVLGEEKEAEEAHLTRGLERSRRQETILVVEDDDDVRAYTVDCLRELGYRVLEAHDGASGLRLIERQSEPLDLLFTDVVMPNMTGRELAERARQLQPGLRVLYTSGYTRDAIIHGGRLEPGVEMIAKPFTYHTLGQQIRDSLDRGQTGRILVVQGDASVRTLTREALEGVGYATDEAATSLEAFSKIRASQGRFDAVVLDSLLDEKDAQTLVSQIRGLHADLAVLITVREGTPVQLSEEQAGDPCLAVVAKPYTVGQLRDSLIELGVRCAQQR